MINSRCPKRFLNNLYKKAQYELKFVSKIDFYLIIFKLPEIFFLFVKLHRLEVDFVLPLSQQQQEQEEQEEQEEPPPNISTVTDPILTKL